MALALKKKLSEPPFFYSLARFSSPHSPLVQTMLCLWLPAIVTLLPWCLVAVSSFGRKKGVGKGGWRLTHQPPFLLRRRYKEEAVRGAQSQSFLLPFRCGMICQSLVHT